MSRTFRIGIVFVGGLVVLLLVGLAVIRRAAQRVPEFYRQALEGDPKDQSKASDRMVRQTTTLANDLRRQGRWEARFTADDVNGWLAVDLPRNFPELLPPNFEDPRVTIAEDGIKVGCRMNEASISGVVSLTFDAYLEQPDVVALRIRKARIGAVPFPLGKVTEGISRALQGRAKVEWAQADGDPVARVTIPLAPGGRAVHIDKLELRNGEIYVAGTTQ
jgi:hypothetical protein